MFKFFHTMIIAVIAFALTSCYSVEASIAQDENIEETVESFSFNFNTVSASSESVITVAEDKIEELNEKLGSFPSIRSEHIPPAPEPVAPAPVEPSNDTAPAPVQDAAETVDHVERTVPVDQTQEPDTAPAPVQTTPPAPPAPAPVPQTDYSGRAAAEQVASSVCGASVQWVNLGPNYLGMYNWGSNSVQINTREGVATQTLKYVAAHECAHVLQYRIFGSLDEARAHMNKVYSSSGNMGLEYNADCIAHALGYYAPAGTPGGYGCPAGGTKAAQAILNGSKP